jgi:hypothetical protein
VRRIQAYDSDPEIIGRRREAQGNNQQHWWGHKTFLEHGGSPLLVTNIEDFRRFRLRKGSVRTLALYTLDLAVKIEGAFPK